MDLNNCTVSAVANLVKQQVGVDVVQLDSKCYPLYDNYIRRILEIY